MTPSEINKIKQQARALYNQQRLPEALNLLNRLCQQHPDEESLCLAGLAHARMNNLPAAEQYLASSLRTNQDYEPAWSGLGNVQSMQRNYQAALGSYKRALEITPKNSQTLTNLANLQRELGLHDEAESNYKQALKIDRKNYLAINNLANIYLNRCQYKLAEEHYRKAIKLNKDYFDAYYNLGAAIQNQGDHKQAIRYYKQAQSLKPSDPTPQVAIANSLEKQGKYAEAASILEPLLARDDISPEAAEIYSKISIKTGELAAGIAQLNNTLKRPLSPIFEQSLRFSLGNLLDKQGEYDAAMSQYKQANGMRPYTYNRNAYEQYFQNISSTFSSLSNNNNLQSTLKSNSPVFVVGMPRSGTTLVEQILCSHSKVTGAGELNYIGELSQLPQSNVAGIQYPANMTHLTQELLDSITRDYLAKLKAHSEGMPHTVDKMPHNFLYIGLIKMMFPESAVINCIRNPLDVCLSIYFHNFNQNHPYTDNLSNLGHYYNLYREIMESWHEMFPGFVLDIQYEALVDDPEPAIQAMLNQAKLPWDDACMKFYENKRIVSTPSYSQVTQPLYTTSMHRWKNYNAHIDQLRESIKPEYQYPENHQ